jgi:regulator of sirC expression with transglutaminase-like and TPR domain
VNPRDALAALVGRHHDAVPLDEGAALLAADDRAEVDVAGVVASFDRIAARVVLRRGASVFENVARLRILLFEGDGAFAGDSDDYHSLENSWVDTVLARRRGMPITLSLVLMEVARRAGLELRGVGFPGHFLVAPAPDMTDTPFWIDPFRGGRVLNEDGLRALYEELSQGQPAPPELWARFTAPVSTRQMLVRINNNLKHSYARIGEPSGALRAVERNLVLDPLAWHERRDRGLLLLQLGRASEGRESLRHYLAGMPDAPDAARVKALLASFWPAED